MITSKDHLLEILNTVFNSFIFGVVLPQMVRDADWSEAVKERAAFEGPNGSITSVELQPMVQSLMDPVQNQRLVFEYEKSLLRALLRESFEAVMAYCEGSKQVPLYKTQPWFQFARIMRNIVSHKDGGVLRQWPRDLTDSGISSVSWRDRTLDSSMVGKPVFFSHQEALHLFKDLARFVHGKLS